VPPGPGAGVVAVSSGWAAYTGQTARREPRPARDRPPGAPARRSSAVAACWEPRLMRCRAAGAGAPRHRRLPPCEPARGGRGEREGPGRGALWALIAVPHGYAASPAREGLWSVRRPQRTRPPARAPDMSAGVAGRGRAGGPGGGGPHSHAPPPPPYAPPAPLPPPCSPARTPRARPRGRARTCRSRAPTCAPPCRASWSSWWGPCGEHRWVKGAAAAPRVGSSRRRGALRTRQRPGPLPPPPTPPPHPP
jgi:hypothetical protein